MKNKVIVTTTINKPTKATLKFAEIAKKKDWIFLIIGDKKTPHEMYENLENKYPNLVYLHPDSQDVLFPDISKMIGWNTIQRRNIGFLIAMQEYNADVVATVDDDNIPYDDWSDDLYIGKKIEVDYWKNTDTNVFDPLSVTNHSNLWHRGFPVQDIYAKNRIEYLGKKTITPLIQADLWDGDPDIDAMCRLSFKPIVKFNITKPFASPQISPFNSQNTFIHKDALKYYAVWPFTGRMDDIWGGYHTQHMIGPDKLIYNRASVYQDRNPQDLIKNLENEIIGYKYTENFVLNDCLPDQPYVPQKTKDFLNIFFNEYQLKK